MADEIKVNDFVLIDVDRIHPDEMNPNEQTDGTFNALVEDIKQDGFDEPLQVCECDCEKLVGKHYVISGGEHRWKAVQVLGYEKVPCTVQLWDEDTRRLKMTRRNLLRGDLNDGKFTALVQSLRNSGGYSDEDLFRLMGFDSQSEFLKHVIDNANGDKDSKSWLQDLIKTGNKEVEAVDSVSDVLNHIFSEYGDTVPQSFMFFAYKGKTHLMVLMDGRLFDVSEKLVAKLKASGGNINDFMAGAIEKSLT